MRVGWLQDDPGYVGGAEMTAQEFRLAAPNHVEIVDCRSGEMVEGLDAYVMQNCVEYTTADLDAIDGAPWFKYLHDMWPHSFDPDVRPRILSEATLIFCSPAHRARMGLDGECVPPPVKLGQFRHGRKGERDGACSIAQWRNPGKGAHLIQEWAKQNDTTVDVYGPGPHVPEGSHVRYHGPLEPQFVPKVLRTHRTYVFLPFEFEPFCRTVVEAHAAGCEIVTNRLVGALHYLQGGDDGWQNGAERFWDLVTAKDRVAA